MITEIRHPDGVREFRDEPAYTIEKLTKERDYAVKARLMAEKDLEMALARIEELEAELQEAERIMTSVGLGSH